MWNSSPLEADHRRLAWKNNCKEMSSRNRRQRKKMGRNPWSGTECEFLYEDGGKTGVLDTGKAGNVPPRRGSHLGAIRRIAERQLASVQSRVTGRLRRFLFGIPDSVKRRARLLHLPARLNLGTRKPSEAEPSLGPRFNPLTTWRGI